MMFMVWCVAGASETLTFVSADPVGDAVRRLEGKLGVPIHVDLGPTHHWRRFPDRLQKGTFSVVVPDGPSELADSLRGIASDLPEHPSWDGCLELEVRSEPWTLQARRVAQVGPDGTVTGCEPYASPLDGGIRARDAEGPRSLGAMCAELSIVREDALDPIADASKLEETTLRTMLATTPWSYRFSESTTAPKTWILSLARPGERVRDLEPADYPFHPAHTAAQQRTARDRADPSRHARLEALRDQRSEVEHALEQAAGNAAP